MVKIVEAPDNVPASQVGKSLYTGIQVRNEQIRKDLEKQNNRQLAQDLVTKLGKIAYTNVMDQRLRERSEEFFNNETYLSNNVLANRAVANANIVVQQQAEAAKDKRGEREYYRQLYIANTLPTVNELAGPNKDQPSLVAIATGLVNETFEERYKQQQELNEKANRLLVSAGGKDLTNYYKAWKTHTKTWQNQSVQRLSELGRLITGKGQPLSADNILKESVALRRMTKEFDQFDGMFENFTNQGMSATDSQQLVNQIKAVPNAKMEYGAVKNIKIGDTEISFVPILNPNGTPTGNFTLPSVVIGNKSSPITKELVAALTGKDHKNRKTLSAGELSQATNTLNDYYNRTPANKELQKEEQKNIEKTIADLGISNTTQQGNLVKGHFSSLASAAKYNSEDFQRNYGISKDLAYNMAIRINNYNKIDAENGSVQVGEGTQTYKELANLHVLDADNPLLVAELYSQLASTPDPNIRRNLNNALELRLVTSTNIGANERRRDIIFLWNKVNDSSSYFNSVDGRNLLTDSITSYKNQFGEDNWKNIEAYKIQKVDGGSGDGGSINNENNNLTGSTSKEYITAINKMYPEEVIGASRAKRNSLLNAVVKLEQSDKKIKELQDQLNFYQQKENQDEANKLVGGSARLPSLLAGGTTTETNLERIQRLLANEIENNKELINRLPAIKKIDEQ